MVIKRTPKNHGENASNSDDGWSRPVAQSRNAEIGGSDSPGELAVARQEVSSIENNPQIVKRIEQLTRIERITVADSETSGKSRKHSLPAIAALDRELQAIENKINNPSRRNR